MTAVDSRDANKIRDDFVAAQVISRAAEEGHDGARGFVDQVNGRLGEALVRRHRAGRLQEGAALAAALGKPDLARFGQAAAMEEHVLAEDREAEIIGAVRSSHTIGYLSPEEIRRDQRTRFVQGLPAAAREQAFDSLLSRLWEDSVSGEGALDDLDQIGVACAAFGGDVTSVFGEGFFQKIARAFKPNAERLAKRIAKIERILPKLQTKLDGLRDRGRKGPNVFFLVNRIRTLTQRLPRLKAKLERLSDVADDVDVAKEDMSATSMAETSAANPRIERDPDENADSALGLEVTWFGAAPHRLERVQARCALLDRMAAEAEENGDEEGAGVLRRRARQLNSHVRKVASLGASARRVSKLEQRLETIEDKASAAEEAGKEGRARKLKLRAIRIRSKLQRLSDKGADVSEDNLTVAPDASDYDNLITPQPAGFTDTNSWVESFFGFDQGVAFGATSKCQPAVGFFARRMERYGMDPGTAFGASGVTSSVGGWLANLFRSRARRTLGIQPGQYIISNQPNRIYQVLRTGNVRVLDGGVVRGNYPHDSEMARYVARYGTRQDPLRRGRGQGQGRRAQAHWTRARNNPNWVQRGGA